MKSCILSLIFFSMVLFINYDIYPQNVSSIKGVVLDTKTQLPLNNVNVTVSDNSYSTVTDYEGKYFIQNIPFGTYQLVFSHVGYKSVQIKVKLNNVNTKKLNINLEQTAIPLGSVIVTSTKFEKEIRDVSLPIEVLDKDEILKSPGITPSDLLVEIPGVTLERDGIWATSVNIRGLSRSSLVTLIDGNRIETATDLSAGLSLINVNDISRIEVIKGATSSLYGTGALGGIINIITKSGGFSQNFLMNGTINSSYNSVNKGFDQNLSLQVSNPFFYTRINGSFEKAGNTQTPAGELQNSQFKDNSYSISLGFMPFEFQKLKINYQKYSANDVGIPGGYPLFPNQAEVKYTEISRDLFDAEYSIGNISKYLNNVSLKYYNQNIYRFVENIPFITQTSQQKIINVQKITPNARHYTNGLQLQTNWSLGNRNILITGFDIWQRKIDSRREKYLYVQNLDSTGNVINTVNQIIGEKPLPNAEYLSMGYYINDELILIKDKLQLNISGRVDQIKISNNEVKNPIYVIVNDVRNNNPANQLINWNSENDKNFSWSGNLGLLYKFSKDINATLDAARSFRSPSLEERYQYIDLGSLIRLGNPNLKPEDGYFMNLGIRIWKEKISVKGDLFYNYLKNLVAEVPGTYENRPARINENIGKAKLYGYDFQIQYNLFDDFVVYGSGAYVRGENVEEGSNLPAIPPLNGKLGFRTTIYNIVNINLSSTHFASQRHVAAGEFTTPGYVYYNLYLSSEKLNIGSVQILLNGGVENLFNNLYRNHLSTNRGLITAEPGRNFFLKLNLNW